ncbi:ATP-binding cassette domain-containing protein [Kribbella sp. NPDC023972]|uniref:ABC transporter ATP-binding protein n=1 Tax=Kribbella sp. NPDC023972 TaxID=3154795 RepID=UPI0033F6D5C5
MTVVKVHNLTVRIKDRSIVDNVSFSLTAGSITAVVGASGSGKTTTALALLGEKPAGAAVTGEVWIDGPVGYMPQQPSSALNPVRRIGGVLREIARLHVPRNEVRERVLEALRQAQLPDGEQLLRRYPHQLSGGQQQRVVLAHELVGRPKVLIADEPTTGQDALIRAGLIDELRSIAEQGIAILLLTHDLDLVRRLADHVLVMSSGAIVDNELPAVSRQQPHEQRASGPPILEVRRLTAGHRRVDTLHEVAVTINAGDTLAVVGRSGSGKTTLARCIAGLHPYRSGELLLSANHANSGDHPYSDDHGDHGDHADRIRARPTRLSPLLRRRSREQLARVQYVHQDARASFNEFVPVLDQVARTAERLRGHADSHRRALDELARLGISEATARRLPKSLSGGELQRAALVRALMAEPDLLICDEITSALDTVAQTELIAVLRKLQETTGCALVVITHDFAVVAALARQVAVMDAGRIVEQGTTTAVLADPSHPVTRALVAAATLEECLDPTG